MIFVDTDLIIDVAHEVTTSLMFLADLEKRQGGLATTSLNVAEIMRGAERQRHPRLSRHGAEGLLRAFREVPFGPKAARRFGEISAERDTEGRPLPVVDGMIAAIVLENGGRLATRNKAGFADIPGLVVLSP